VVAVREGTKASDQRLMNSAHGISWSIRAGMDCVKRKRNTEHDRYVNHKKQNVD
jgi:hypothetical protein